jgi:uracil phosphoribosyltransferase
LLRFRFAEPLSHIGYWGASIPEIDKKAFNAVDMGEANTQLDDLMDIVEVVSSTIDFERLYFPNRTQRTANRSAIGSTEPRPFMVRGSCLPPMPIEDRDQASLVTHALAKDTLSRIRDENTEQVAFRKGLVKLGRICGYEIIDGVMDTEYVTVQTPLTETTGERVKGLDDVVIINVLRAATPFVEGLLKAFPRAKQGVISAGRDEEAGMDETGAFPISIDYQKLPEITKSDTVVVADPMLATGSTMCTVLEHVLDEAEATPENLFVLSAVSAPEGLLRVGEEYPEADLLTVSIDDKLDEEGFIVPGLGDAGDRAFRTK